jgi:hypothetical protein
VDCVVVLLLVVRTVRLSSGLCYGPIILFLDTHEVARHSIYIYIYIYIKSEQVFLSNAPRYTKEHS